MHRRSRILAFGLALALVGCSGETDPRPDAAGGGSGGAGGSGGTGGSAGAGGSGGSADAGSDAGTGGTGGSGGADGGSSAPGKSLDECFAGLPPPSSFALQRVSTHASADGKVRFRIALDTMGFGSTSGTTPWHMVRFALEADGVRVCLSGPAVASAYKATHHNCLDTASITADGVRYDIADPDNRIATISAVRGTTPLWGPVTVTSTMCVEKSAMTTFPVCRDDGGCA